MTARSTIPWAILGLLTLLTAGSAAFAVSQSSNDPNTTVHNASDTTFSASSFILQSSIKGQTNVGAVAYKAPNTFTQFKSGASGPVVARVTGTQGDAVLKQYSSIVAGDGWKNGNASGQFVRTETLAQLSSRAGTAQQSGVTGTVDQTAIVADGQLTGVVLDVTATEAGQSQKEVETLNWVRINGQTTPPLPTVTTSSSS